MGPLQSYQEQWESSHWICCVQVHKAAHIWVSLRVWAGLPSDLGAADSCELHQFPLWRAEGRIPHQKPHYKVLLGMADLSLSQWMPRSMNYPLDNKDVSFCLRHPRHFPKVPVWLRAVTFQSNVFLICSRTLCGAIKVSLQKTCYYTAWKLN